MVYDMNQTLFSGCAFCQLVLFLGHDLTETDRQIYRGHLRQEHGWMEEIQP